MKTATSFLITILLIVPSSVMAGNSFDLGQIQRALQRAQEVMGQATPPGIRSTMNNIVSGVVTISDVSRPWYFKMDMFDAAAASRIYVQVNDRRPQFLVEFLGTRPPVGAPIKLEGLQPGDRVRFSVRTCWHGRKYGPVDSSNARFFRVIQKGPKLYYFQFEDAAGYDMAYNDGAFYLYQEGYGPKVNQHIWIKRFDVLKVPGGLLLSGTVHVEGSGPVSSKIDIRDNRWRIYKVIGLNFNTFQAGDRDFQYKLTDRLPAPMYTAIWQVGFMGERDSRLRALKGCLDTGTGSLPPLSGTDEGLVAYYSFDDCSAMDKGPNHLNGIIYGSPQCIGGLQVNSLYFNKVDKNNGCGRPGGDFIQLPSLGPIFQRGITICAWARFESPRHYEKILDIGNGPGERGGYNVVFGRLGTSNDIELESWIDTDGSRSRTTGRITSPGIVNGEWRYYCATIDNQSRMMRIYVNGRLMAEKVGNPVLNVPRSNNFIAHSNWCYNDPDFKGAIDELRIYDRALSRDEIRRLYSKHTFTRPSSVQGNAFGSTQKNPFIFQGTIYFLPVGTARLPDLARLQPVGKIYAATLNISPRSFLQGFPGVTDRFEWFAIDYKGKIYLKKGGTYTFSLLSDDGSKLLIDGKTVIDNDGIHPPVEKFGSVRLGRGLHDIEVQYFQGPRQQVALVLSMVQGGRKVPFDIREFAPVTMKEGQRQTQLTLGAGILFDFNSYSLRPEAISVLDSVYDLLRGYDYTKVVVEGHTDDIGSESYNLRLSMNRARSVANYLIAKGVPRKKIEVIGYGEKRPRYPNDTEEHRAKNRRVEIKILKR